MNRPPVQSTGRKQPFKGGGRAKNRSVPTGKNGPLTGIPLSRPSRVPQVQPGSATDPVTSAERMSLALPPDQVQGVLPSLAGPGLGCNIFAGTGLEGLSQDTIMKIDPATRKLLQDRARQSQENLTITNHRRTGLQSVFAERTRG